MSSSRNGFSLVELVSVLVVLAIFGGVALPKLDRARRDAKTIDCSNKIRQICLAAHNYHSAYQRFPAATIGVKDAVSLEEWKEEIGPNSWANHQNVSSLSQVSPFMELSEVYDQIDPLAFNVKRVLGDYVNVQGDRVYQDCLEIAGVNEAINADLDCFRCPADSLEEKKLFAKDRLVIATQPILLAADAEDVNDDIAVKMYPHRDGWAKGLTNYLANGGVGGGNCTRKSDFDEQKRYLGPIYSRSKTTIANLSDGTSNTLIFGETLGGIAEGKRDKVHSWLLGGQARGRGDVPWGKSVHPDNDARRMLGDKEWSSIVGFGSKHAIGVNFARADGSVLTISHDIEIDPFYNLLGARDGVVFDGSGLDQLPEMGQ